MVKNLELTFGLSFKPNIDDLRESPAKYITQKLLQETNNQEYLVIEPNIENHPIYKLSNFKDAARLADILVFLVAHDEFKQIKIERSKHVLDFCGIFN